MRLPHPHLLVGTCVLCCAQAFGQTPPVSSPQALSLAAQSLRSLAGGTTLADVTMQATANYTFRAKNEVGTATLVARGNTQSLLTLNFSDGTGWQEIRNRISGVSVNADGTVTSSATHNCFIDADWFFPALSLQALANDPTSVVNLPGQQIYEGQQVYHLTFTRYLTGQVPEVSSLIQAVSSMDLYLDATTLPPVALDFNSHPSKDAYTNSPTEIRFGAYQSFNGSRLGF